MDAEKTIEPMESYEAPTVETVLTADKLTREVQYAGDAQS